MGKELHKILFIDDDEDIHTIVKLCLRTIPNLELKNALSGEEGLKILAEFPADLILLDVMMPKMDGITTLNAIRKMSAFADTPVVFLTAKAQKYEVESYYQYGIADVIVKPFEPATLADTIIQIWNKWLQRPPSN